MNSEANPVVFPSTWIARSRAVTAVLAAAAVLWAGGPASASPARRKRPRKPEPTAVPRPPDPNKVTLTTADGVVIAGTWRPVPGDPKAPAVLLLHDFSRDRREWDGMAQDFLVRGLATLTIDLRGHGESTRRTNGGTVPLSPRLLRDRNGLPRDVRAALEWLRGRSPSVGVIGLSTGANLALLASANGWADTAVAVSANLENLHDLAGALPYRPKKALVLASRLDPGREASAKELNAEGSEPKKLVLFPGAAHNMVLLAGNLGARREALEWLASRLGAVPAATLSRGPGGGTFLSPMVGAGAPPAAPTPFPPANPSLPASSPTPTPTPR